MLLVGSALPTYEHTGQELLAERRVAGGARLALYAELLRGWLGTYRARPSIYAHEPDVVALLRPRTTSRRWRR